MFYIYDSQGQKLSAGFVWQSLNMNYGQGIQASYKYVCVNLGKSCLAGKTLTVGNFSICNQPS
jgi:hypothetical protein